MTVTNCLGRYIFIVNLLLSTLLCDFGRVVITGCEGLDRINRGKGCSKTRRVAILFRRDSHVERKCFD